jgi:AcrR family transcriptional regulator
MVRATKRRAGRRSGAAAGRSRAAVLKAARRLFAKYGFNKTTTRAIARQAGVDAALVHYFFDSKAKLFAAAVDLPVQPLRLAAMVSQTGEGPLGERIARYFLEEAFALRNESIAALIRAAVGNPDVVPMLRAAIEQRLVSVVSTVLPGPDARLRAELMGAQMMGLFISRHIVRIEPLASASTEEIAQVIGPALEAILGLK